MSGSKMDASNLTAKVRDEIIKIIDDASAISDIPDTVQVFIISRMLMLTTRSMIGAVDVTVAQLERMMQEQHDGQGASRPTHRLN